MVTANGLLTFCGEEMLENRNVVTGGCGAATPGWVTVTATFAGFAPGADTAIVPVRELVKVLASQVTTIVPGPVPALVPLLKCIHDAALMLAVQAIDPPPALQTLNAVELGSAFTARVAGNTTSGGPPVPTTINLAAETATSLPVLICPSWFNGSTRTPTQ